MPSDKHQSREILTMETESTSKMSFKPKGGWFIKREVLLLLALIYLCSVVAIGLMVYYLSPCEGDSNVSVEPSMEELEERLTDVRLPRHVWPITYDIKLKPLFDANYTIEGSVTITMRCYEPSNNITLHIHNMTVLDVTVKDSEGRAVGGDSVEADEKRQFLIIKLDEDMIAGQMYTTKINFNAILNNELAGFYRSSYRNEQEVVIATTQFQPTDARRAFPCFDEPEFKAKFKVSLGRMKNMSSLSNMPIESTEVEGDWQWDHYEETGNMSTYLLAFVISDFEKKDYEYDAPWKFSIYGRSKAIEMGETDYAGNIAPRIMAFYEEFYDISYPLPKCDMIAIPDFSAGAMENWGLVTYRETTLLYNSKVSAASDKKRVALVVSHELAHQWFGNLVTPAWWTDLWLNEGFASYVEYLGVDHVQPTWRMMEQLVVNDMQSVMGMDSLLSSHKISVPVSNPDEINEIFDGISYSKGGAIIRMMNNFLTNKTFEHGLTKYLKAFSYTNANQDDLWRYLTMQGHKDNTLPKDVTVKQIMDTWTLQMGYPVVTVKRSKTSAQISQERFLLSDQNINTTEDDTEYTWWIPITFTNKQDKNFSYENTRPSHWIAKEQQSISIENVAASEQDWVIFNIQEVGYFRVNYDVSNWQLLIDQLQTNHEEIAAIQRSQILDDALNLARAHRLDYNIALDLTTYLHKETDYFPLISAFNDLEYLDAMLTRTSAYGHFKKFARGILDKLFNENDFESLKNADTNYPDLSNTYKQILVIQKACEYENEVCINQTRKMFHKFMDNYDENKADDDPDNQITPDLKDTVYCTAIKYGKEDEWNFLWKHYTLTTVPSEKATVLKSLACTKQVWILSKYLDGILNETSGIRKQDGVTVFSSVAHNSVGRYLAWDFLRDRWNDIKIHYGVGFTGISRMVRAVTGSFNTKFNLQQLKNFQENKKNDLRSATRATKQAIEKVQANIKWMEKCFQIIVDWLTKQNQK